MDADFAAERIDLLVVILFEIDGAVHAEGGNAAAGLGVELDHAIAGSEVDDALVVAIGPVREAAAGETAGRDFRALAFVLAMNPEFFAGSGVERDDVAAVAGGGIEHAIHHQRRRFQIGLHGCAQDWPC